jgi:hypothetical protein
MAKLLRQSGRPAAAEAMLQKALKAFPGYYFSREELAELHSQGSSKQQAESSGPQPLAKDSK